MTAKSKPKSKPDTPDQGVEVSAADILQTFQQLYPNEWQVVLLTVQNRALQAKLDVLSK